MERSGDRHADAVKLPGPFRGASMRAGSARAVLVPPTMGSSPRISQCMSPSSASSSLVRVLR